MKLAVCSTRITGVTDDHCQINTYSKLGGFQDHVGSTQHVKVLWILAGFENHKNFAKLGRIR